MGENTLMEIGRTGIKSENQITSVSDTSSFRSPLETSFSESLKTVSTGSSDSALSPASAQAGNTQESPPMTSQTDSTKQQVSPTLDSTCQSTMYTEMKPSPENPKRTNLSPPSNNQQNQQNLPNKQIQSPFGSIANQYQVNLSSAPANSASNQGTFGVNSSASSRETLTNSSDAFYQSPDCLADFPSGPGQFSVRTPINGGYNLMDNYSAAFPGDRQISRTSKGNLPTDYGHQQISGHKSNQLSPMEKQSSLPPEQKLFSYAVESSARIDTGYKSGNCNTQFHYTSNFNLNSNTYSHPRGYTGYNNGLHGDNLNLHGSMSTEEFDGQNHQLKQGSFTPGQLNVYQNGIYQDGYYGAPFNSGVNRTMSAALLSQQSYLNTSPASHGSNMAENNGSFEQFGSMETAINAPNGDFSSLFGDYYSFPPQHGFQT